jgi:GntR family transcriptional repressor for pyruvate dehydrogenase complex
MQPSVIEPIPKQRLAQRVAGSLRRLIADQGLEAGQRLPTERDLASALAVSRHVVREALRQLELEGVIVSSHGNGTFVQQRPEPAQTTTQDDEDRHTIRREARTVFEAGLAELIVERATEADIEGLTRILADMRSLVMAGRPSGSEDVLFHELLLRCTRNEDLIRIGRTLIVGYLHDRLIGGTGALVYAPESVDLEPHEAILTAIKNRDPEALRQCLRIHGYPPASGT